MKSKKQFLIAATSVWIILSGCSSGETNNSADKNAAAVPKTPVDAVLAYPSGLDMEEIIEATLKPLREVVIKSELSKKITSITFKDGSYVHQGQVLYYLEDSDIKAKYNQIKAELSLAKLNEQRTAELLAKNAVSQEEYDIALTKLRSLKASEELVISELEKTKIRAPFSGVIGISKVHIGTLVNPGTELVTLQDNKILKVEFFVPEKLTTLVKNGDKINFTSGETENKLSAKILASEPGMESSSRSILVQAVATEEIAHLKPGMSAKVYLKAYQGEISTYKIPTESLIPGADGYQVYTVKNGVATPTPVTIIDRDENYALVTSGIEKGDSIVTSNTLRLMPGAPVEIVSTKNN